MILNGKTYKLPELDFNMICRLEDMGVTMTSMDKKALSTVRGFIALAMEDDLERAGRELEAHIVNGGKLDELMEDIHKAVTESGFFRALKQSPEAGNTQSEGKKEQETKKAQ